MSITGNKGEWSEMYTFFKLLGDGVLYAGDENLDKIKDLFYPIVMIPREENTGKHNYRVNERTIRIETPSGKQLFTVSADEFLNQAGCLLSAIKKGEKSIPETEQFMSKVFCHQLKARGNDKSDIHIILHDRRTKMNSEMGFSIKSQLGNDATLLKATKATNFVYRIEGQNLSDDDVTRINAISTKEKIIDRVQAIEDLGCKLAFDRVDNLTFANNLTMLDGDLPKIIGHLLIERFQTGEKMIHKLVDALNRRNPMGYDMGNGQMFYQYKIKHLITSAALGMMPSKTWNGKFDANGGYIVVKSDGDIVCYHFYDRNRFEDFLYRGAYLERGSTKRHEYASIVKDNNGNLTFKINLQIRLK